MKRVGWSFVGVGLALALGSAARTADAKQTGMNLACHNCHEGQDKPQVSATLSAMRVEPGQSVTINVTAKHARAKVGGVLVDSHGQGAFDLIDTVGTRLYDNIPTQATHAMPQLYANGQVQFSFRWVAPSTPGAVAFDVWSNAANGDLMPHDDSATGVLAGIGVGCDALWYHLDADKDGAGAEIGKMLSCTPIPDRITQGGDCHDQNPLVNPSAVETCNSVDDDCDGVPDDGFTPVLLVTDADGDGHGSTSGMSMIGCPPLPNFAPSFDDCNDTDATIHPGAVEVANGRDDNCNSKVDDVAAGPIDPGTAGTTGMGTPVTNPPADGGCALAAPTRPQALQSLHLLGAALLLGLAQARRVRRFNARENARPTRR